MAKSVRGGKYGRDTAGVRHELTEKDWGTKREFVGSGANAYTFYSASTNTTLVIRAESYDEAKRIARSSGFKQYRSRRKRNKR